MDARTGLDASVADGSLPGAPDASGRDAAEPRVDGSAAPMDGSAAPTDASAAPLDARVPPADASPPPPGASTCRGYATRYWDCCKAHCGWEGNTTSIDGTLRSCGLDDAPQASFSQPSSCGSSDAAASYTCFSMAPRAVTPTLAYGYAAVPAEGDICGRCYRLDFDGTGHYDASDPGSRALVGRTMIVQATNIGFDVGGGQFDILIPGGGVGAFNACTRQWGLGSDAPLGAQYGGFLTACREAGGSHDEVRACVRARCDSVFGEPRFAELRAGCDWFVDWFQAADNPNLDWSEVPCPAALVDESGLDRRGLDDVSSCGGGGSPGTCECDCSWAADGCGADDGSCCWDTCCG